MRRKHIFFLTESKKNLQYIEKQYVTKNVNNDILFAEVILRRWGIGIYLPESGFWFGVRDDIYYSIFMELLCGFDSPLPDFGRLSHKVMESNEVMV